MTLLEAIDARVSRRTYRPEPLSGADADAMRGAAADCEGGRMALVVGDGRAFVGLTKSYGMFGGVQNCVVLVAYDADTDSEEKLGYYGERLVLKATAMGLGTCWVGGTFDKKALPVTLNAGERVVGVITVGYTAAAQTGKERLIRGLARRKTKTAAQMTVTDAPPPSWFTSGVEAAQKAPSAVNRQPVTFGYEGGVARAFVKDMGAPMAALDLGIAKLHFEIGAGGGAWLWGSGGAFEMGRGDGDT